MHQASLDRREVIVDTRSSFDSYLDFLRSPAQRGALQLSVALISLTSLLMPIQVMIVFNLLIWPWLLPIPFIKRIPVMPARLPREADCLDISDPKPGNHGYHNARGEIYLGNDRATGKEVWLSWNDARLHAYFMAATGGGKSEGFLAWCANFWFAGSAYVMGDGKGTQFFPKQHYTLARIVGAEDDVFGVNYITGDKDRIGRRKTRPSNMLNPFGPSSAATNKEILTSLMPESDGENAIFSQGAGQLAEYLTPALSELSQLGELEVDIHSIGQYLPLAEFRKLMDHPKLSQAARNYIYTYLSGQGYQFEKEPHQQPDNVTKMHAYYTNYFQKIISSFTVGYGDIYLTDQSEIDVPDIINNRRCLIFSLPALEKSGPELSALGKVLLTLCRNGAARGLGDEYEGSREETVDRLPDNWPTPYGMNFDEFSFYVIKDFSLLPAQVRGINISNANGAQDYIGTERGSVIDAESIWSNARFKIIGALEDSGKTWDKIAGLLGEVDMVVNAGVRRVGTFMSRYLPNTEPTIHRRKPLEVRDLQALDQGAFAMIFRGKYTLIDFFYTDITADTVVDNIEYHRLTRVYYPDENQCNHLRFIDQFQSFLYQERSHLLKLGCLTVLQQELAQSDAPVMERCLNAVLRLQQEFSYSIGNHTSDTKAETIENSASEDSIEDDCGSNQEMPEYLYDEQDANSGDPDQDYSMFTSGLPDDVDAYQDVSENPIAASNDALPNNDADSLLDRSRIAMDEIFSSGAPEHGVTISDEHCDTILNHLVLCSKLLGESDDVAYQAAQSTVNNIKCASFYLVPPEPERDNSVDDMLKMQVERILSRNERQQADHGT